MRWRVHWLRPTSSGMRSFATIEDAERFAAELMEANPAVKIRIESPE